MSETRDSPHDDIIFVEDETLREGFTQIPNTILRREDLSPGAKLTYMALLSYSWQKGSCFPGQDTLAEDLGVSRRSVITYLQHLQKSGLLKIKRRGLGKTNVYLLPRFTQARSENFAHQEVQNLHSEEYPVEEYSNKNIKTSNIRNTSSSKKTKNGETNYPQMFPAPSGNPQKTGADTDQDISRDIKSQSYDEARQVIADYIADFSIEMGDEAKLKSSVTRAYNLFRKSGLELPTFLNALYEARSRTKQATASIKKERSGEKGMFRVKNKMPFYFAVVEDLLGLREKPAGLAPPS